jgi:RimJ/RimL family protein N-acetyltransferase
MVILSLPKQEMQLVNSETVLETKRLLLQPLRRYHAAVLYPLLQDESIYTYIPQDPPTSLKILEQRYQKLENRLSPDLTQAWLNWAVCIKANKEYAGYIQASIHTNCHAEIAYVFASLFWGQGYAQEACEYMLSFLQKKYGVTEITAEVDTRNRKSIRLLERLGFSRAEKRENVDFFKGISSDEYLYRLVVESSKE